MALRLEPDDVNDNRQYADYKEQIQHEEQNQMNNIDAINEAAEKYADKDFANKSSFEFHNQYTSYLDGIKSDAAKQYWYEQFKEEVSELIKKEQAIL